MKTVSLFLFILDFPLVPHRAGSQKMFLSQSQMDFFLASPIILFHFCLAQQTRQEDSEGDAC